MFSRAVTENLTPGEREIITLRRHPAILFSPLATALGAIIVAVGTSSLHVVEWMKIVVWLLSVLFIWSLIAAFKGWYSGRITLTSKRMILSGPSSGEFETIRLTPPVDISLQRSWRGRLIWYGDLVITTNDKGDRVLTYIPYPQQIYLEVSQLTAMPFDEGND